MKFLFSGLFIILVALSVVAVSTAPPSTVGNRKIIIWATDDNPERAEQVATFNRLNPDLLVKIDPVNNAQEKIIVQSVGGVGPDVFGSYGYNALKVYVNSGIAYDLTDDFLKAGIRIEEATWPVALSSCIFDGRTYAFPANVNAGAIWYNKDLFDKYNVPYPKDGWTWEDLIATAKKLTIRDKNGRPTQFGVYFPFDDWRNILVQHGGRIFNEDGTECVIDSEPARAAFELIHSLMYEHKITPSPVEEATMATSGGWGSGGITLFMGGKVAMAYGGRWWLNLMRKQKGLNLGAVELPYARVPRSMGGARVTMVNRKSKNLDGAIRFAIYMASVEYSELIDRQADALAPLKSVSYSPRFLRNPEHPEETYNAVWRATVEKAVPEEVNPFVKGSDLDPLNKQIDLIKSNVKEIPDALRDAQINMNARIRRAARISPPLAKLYEEKTGQKP